jgi:hypothetical protein
MLHFCTYFDSHYLARALALYDSLQEHCAPFELFVLCLDNSGRAMPSRLLANRRRSED